MRHPPFDRVGVLVAFCATLGTTGCVRHYQPPTAAQPHAAVKIRRTFERFAGTHLRERTSVNGHVAEQTTVGVALASAPRTSAVLVHPVPASIDVGGGFFHFETRTVLETYSVQVPYYTTESYSCGSGTRYQTCTRSVTQYRSESRTRWVTRQVEVSDGACSSAIKVAPKAGHIYVLDYTYRDNRVCSMTCVEQTAILSDGSFQSAPCPALTPAEQRTLDEDDDD